MSVPAGITADQLAARLDGVVEGDGARVITTAAALDQATPDALSWVGDPRYHAQVGASQAGIILVGPANPPVPGRTVIRVADPDAALLQVLDLVAPLRVGPPVGIDPSAVVHPDADVTDACIGANVYVGAGAVVGAGTILHPGVHVGALCRIGPDCELWPNVVVRERVTIGARVVVHPNTTIGSDGFGYLQRNGGHVKIPQIGTVVIEDDVEIGANCAIDRARTGATRIGSGTKIDNLVQIAHNVEIGRGCIIIAGSAIGGSSILEDHVMLAGHAGVSDHLRVGRGARIAAKSAIFKDLPPGETVRGVPAIEHRQFLRQQASVRKLPKWAEELRRLRQRVEQLEAQRSLAGETAGETGS